MQEKTYKAEEHNEHQLITSLIKEDTCHIYCVNCEENYTLEKPEKTLEEQLKDLTCVNGAMYFGAVEHPCSGRETGECCQNEQTYEEAFAELLSFISSREEKAREEGRKEERQFILNILDGIDTADKQMGIENSYVVGHGGTKAIRLALQNRII